MISVIISPCSDAALLKRTLAAVYGHASYKRLLKEVIVVESGQLSSLSVAQGSGATIVHEPTKCRARLLNAGARQATGKILYFLPAGSLPPEHFISDLAKAYTKGFESGTFSLRFDNKHWMLNGISWVTNRFSSSIHVSDQSLFMTRELFEKSGGFREDHLVMANQEMIRRLKRYSRFTVINDQVLSLTEKFVKYGFVKTGLLQALVYVMHKIGYPQHSMTRLYRKFLRWDIGPKLPEKENKLSELLETKQESVSQMTLQQPS